MEVSKRRRRHSVSVRKVKTELDVNFIDDFHFSVRCGSIAICGRGNVDNQSQNEVFLINGIVPDAHRLYKWRLDTNGKNAAVLVLSNDGSVRAVSLPSTSSSSLSSLNEATSQADILWVYPTEKLKQAIGLNETSSLPKVSVLSAEQGSISLLIGNHFYQVPEAGKESSSPPDSWMLSWQQTGIQEEDIVQARLQGGFLFTLHPSGNISIFSIHHQKLVAHVNHKDFIHSIFVNAGVLESQDTGKPYDFDVSADLQNIIVTYINAKYGVYRINLAEYFSHNPRHVLTAGQKQQSVQKRKSSKLDKDEDELDFTRGASPVSEKGKPTNRSWWNYLDDLRLKLTKDDDDDRHVRGSFASPSANDIKAWLSWYLIADGQLSMFNPRSVSSGQSDTTPRVHVSGFQRKVQRSTQSGSTKTGSPRSSRVETSTDLLVSTAVRTAKLCKGLSVRGVYAGNYSALVWYGGNLQGQSGDRYGGLCFLNFSDNSTQFESFQEPTLLSISKDPTEPHTLLTRSEVRLLSISMEQESVVNKMMVYKSAAVTEALCYLNNWDHCSIPIHALEIGLKHRQLDTIAFFLKSRENMFRLKQHTAPVAMAALHHSDLSSSNDATQLWLAMDLLCLAIAGNIKEMQSKQYALQVLNLALNHLNKLIHNATDSLEHVCTSSTSSLHSSSKRSSQASSSSGTGISPSFSSLKSDRPRTAPRAVVVVTEGFEGTNHDLQDILKKLIGYTVKLRGHLKGASTWMFSGKDDTDSGSLSTSDTYYTGTNKAMVATMHAWKAMLPQEIIQEAILKRHIPLAQAFLRKQQYHLQLQHSETQQAVTSLDSKGLPLLIDSGLAQVYSSLLNAETETAYTLLQNLGFNVTDEIKKICLYTANTGLRDFLISELNQSHDLSEEEAEMVHFVHQLEHLYTCQSFEKAKALASEKSKRHKDKSQEEEWLPPDDEEARQYLKDIVVRGEIMVSSEPANCENFNYGHVVLEWVRSWRQETRDRILLERLLASRSKDPSFSYNLSADSAWSYLTSHHHWDQLKLWIRSSLTLNPDLSTSSMDPVSPWLHDLKLLPGVVHKMESCLPYLREKILDELARHGIFSSAELATFDLLTRRLSSTQQLFRHPHPLGQRSETASVAPSFKQWFLDMCIEKQLPGLLYAFLDFYSLCLSENEVMSLQLPLAQCPWLEIMLHFRWIGRQVSDPSLVFQASLSNARLLMKVTQPTVSGLMDAGYPIIAIATLLYAPGSIPEALSPATNEEEKLWKLDGDRLQQALRPYPKLLSAVFPSSSIDGIKPQDITVYELLQGNSPLDPRKLFLWQTTNKVISPEDTTSEMPYFSDPSLIERYAYTEAFSYTYYLRQGRPSFAYTTFITSLLQEGVTFTKKILFEVYVKAYTTALRSFTNLCICAACTAFIEMLGRDSLSLRTDLQTARTIAEHLKGQLTRASRSVVKGQQGVSLEKTMKEKKETVDRDMVNLMMSCVKGSGLCAKSILMKLEHALTSQIEQQKIDRVSWKAAEEWNLAVMFCRLHNIVLTTVFPIECTRADNWLLFICFVQTHQYPKHQVLDLVKSFRSSTIREHMSHALSHLQYGPAPSQDTDQSQGGGANAKSKLPIKDYRTAYYTKMGFLKDGADASADTSDTEDEEDQSGSRLELSHDEISTTDTETVEDLELGDVSQELFEIIFKCGNHSVPWKAFLSHSILLQQPVLAVIAACHQGANILDCLCCWLYTSLSDDPNLERNFGPSLLLKTHVWNLDELRNLIDIAMATGRVTLLTKGFHIFDNRGLLNSFLAFCDDFLILRDRSQCKIDLEFFHEAILTCRRRSSMKNQPDPGPSRPRVGHLDWFQETANHMARNMLLSCTSQWEIGFLLEVFTALNFSRTVDSSDPDYSSLHRLHKALQGTGLELSISRMLDSTDGMVSECRTLLDKLQTLGKFDQAKEFAAAAGLSIDHVVIQQILSDLTQIMRSEVGSTEAGRIAFWVKCNERLSKAKVKHQSAAEFFQTQSEEKELTGDKRAREKAILLDLAYQWLSHPKSNASRSSLRALEQKVWLWRLRAEVNKKRQEVTTSMSCLESHSPDWTPKSRGPRELLYDVQPADKPVYQLQNEKESSALKDMIDGLLSSCCIAKAHQLASQFGYIHNDLSITLACLQLMQGKVKPEGIDPFLRSQVKVAASKPKLTRRPSNLTLLGPSSGTYGGRSKKPLGRSPSVISLGINQELSSAQTDDTLTMMEALADHTSAARKCCDRITNIYRISQVLDKSYDSLIKQVPFTSVKALLQSNHPDRYILAKDFIRANNLADNEVANFLSDVVMTGLQQKVKRRKESSLTRPPPSDGPSPDRMEKVAFMSLARLCKDPACLGTRLLDEATQIAHSDLSTTRPALTLEVELIIRAHDCFTLSCNMEGIASVLRASCDCCSALAQTEEFSLMVRLLIGVRRFSEMTYIFEILRANHQMDALLKRGANDDKLKVALLDFLKRCDPPDTETYGIVALKFEMHREVGSLLEQDAKDRLRTLKSRTMDTNIEIQNILENVLHDITNAAKNYAKDNCLRHAEKCIKQARLVALQIRLLPVRTRVINFEFAEVTKFVTQHPKFHEVLIVQDAYQQQSEWSNALYNNVILQGNFKYLEDFQSCIQLTASHCNDVAARYRQLTNKSTLVVTHMQRFLSHCPDVLTAYRLANQLEYKEMAISLLKGDAGAYLSDVA